MNAKLRTLIGTLTWAGPGAALGPGAGRRRQPRLPRCGREDLGRQPRWQRRGADQRGQLLAERHPGRRRHDRRGHRCRLDDHGDRTGWDGSRIRQIETPPAKTSNGGGFAAKPVNVAFSPDGSKATPGKPKKQAKAKVKRASKALKQAKKEAKKCA